MVKKKFQVKFSVELGKVELPIISLSFHLLDQTLIIIACKQSSDLLKVKF